MARAALPKRYAKDYGTLLTDFTTKAPTAIAGTMTQNAASATRFLSGSQSWWMKLTGATDTLGQARFNEALDLSGVSFIHVWLYDNSGNGTNDLGSDIILNFYGQTDAYATTTNKYKWASSSTGWPDSTTFDGKWKCVTFRVDSPTVSSGAGLAGIQWWMIELDNRGGNDCEIWIDSIYLDAKARPKLLWMFDDGSASDFTLAYDYLYTQNGKLGTSFIISETMAGGSELTLANAKTMYANGWSIANHSKDAVNLDTLSVADAVTNVITCRDYLIDNGMPKMANFLAFPGNATSSALNTALTEAGIVFGRVGQKSTTYFPSQIGHPDSPSQAPFDMINFPANLVLNETNYDAGAGTGAVQKAYAIEAARQSAAILISTHKIVTSGATGVQTNQASFEEFVDWTIQKEKEGFWDIVSLEQWYNGLTYNRVIV